MTTETNDDRLWWSDWMFRLLYLVGCFFIKLIVLAYSFEMKMFEGLVGYWFIHLTEVS